jgi:hypothetical protein
MACHLRSTFPSVKFPVVIHIKLSQQEHATSVAIGGRLIGADLDELKQVRHSVSGAVILDLKDLLSADAENLVELRDWIQHGARIQGASSYLEILLEQDPSPDKPQDTHQ